MITKCLIIITCIFLYASTFSFSQQNLVIGFIDPYEDTLISGVTTQYDTLFILNNGNVIIDYSDIIINQTIVCTDSARLTVKNSSFSANGSCVFFGNSQAFFYDSLRLNCDLICGANASLNIDSATVYSNMSYIGQYKLLGFDHAEINITNSDFDLNNGKFGGGFLDHASFNQYQNHFTSSVGIAMTLGFNNSSRLTVDECSGGMEIIMNDSSYIELTNSDTFILWFGFDQGDTVNTDFPVTNPVFPPSSNVSNYLFSDTLSGVNGVDFELNINNCNTIYWALLLYSGCNITMNNDSLIAVGIYYRGNATDSLTGLINNQTYSSFNSGMSDRNLILNNTQVLAWNFYPGDQSKIVIKDCLFGEVLTFNDATAEVISSTCDGTGGYFGASENSNIYVKNSIIERTYNGPDIILHKDNSYTVLENCEVIGNITLNKNAKHIHNNTIHNDNLTVNEAAYFLNVYLDTLYNTFVDSTVEISGSLFDVKAILNMDFISGFKLSYSLPDSSNMITIVDSSCTPYIANSIIYNWNTNSVTQGNYILWLSVFLNGDSLVSASREIVLQDISSVFADIDFKDNFNIYPNPAKDYTEINILVEKESDVIIKVTDIYGRQVYKSSHENIQKGSFITKIDLKDMDVGAYNITCRVNNHSLGTKKMIVK